MPSADVTPKGELFVMQESQVRFWQPKPYWNSTHFYCFGVDGTTEIALTLFNVGVPSTGNATLANGAKTVVPVLAGALPDAEIKLTAGLMALFSLERRGVGYWSYGHVSGRVPWLRTRLAGGVSVATEQLYERKLATFIGSLEQPLGTEKLNLVAEWFSGEHDLGNFIYGVTFHPNHTWIFVVGHKIPTNGELGRSKMALVGEVGLFF
ncbi:MAG: hypothetical protein JNL38_16375 [Myxococcales bacterium]|jgi:hypothetical protein|nr:hypothetical protein [Myxococcales bacterium]